MASTDRKRPLVQSGQGFVAKRRMQEILPSDLATASYYSPDSSSIPSSPTSSLDTWNTSNTLLVHHAREEEHTTLDTADVEQVCFGTIEKVLVQLKWFPKSAIETTPTLTLSPLDFQSFSFVNLQGLRVLKLSFNHGEDRDYCLVQVVPGGENVGVLERRAVKYLSALALDPVSSITFEAVVEESIWKDKITSAMSGGGRAEQRLLVDINAFGQRHMGEGVGRVLGGSGIFLQRPSRQTFLPYENPQCMDLPYSRHPEVLNRVLPLLYDLDNGEGDLRRAGNDTTLAGVSRPSLNFDQMMEGFRGSSLSGNVYVDPRVITPLLRHQKEGLEFIAKRESLTMPESQGLWEPLGTEPHVVGYRHAITGAKSRTADDSPGGILADDMGLGKSLTMIAAMLGSSNEAREYSAQNTTSDTLTVNIPSPLFLKATLIVVPSELLLANWIEELDKHTATGSVRYFKYHGRERHDTSNTDPSHLQAQDIVLTTYGTVAADFGKGGGLITKYRWYRVILDEAHIIRNWSTRQFNAVSAITAHIRWCVTGTPIQNRLEDLGALVQFLRLPVLKDPVAFRRYICPSSNSDPDSVGRNNSKITRQDSLANLRLMLGSICLRRAQVILHFRFTTEVIRPRFADDEEREYQTLVRRTREALVDSVGAKAAHTNVLEQLLRLREFCNGVSPGGGGTSAKGGGDTVTSAESIFDLMVQDHQAAGSGNGVCCEYCSVEIASLEAGSVLTGCRRIVCGDVSCTSRYWSRGAAGHDNTTSRNVGDTRTSTCPFCNTEHTSNNLLADTKTATVLTLKPPKRYPTKLLELLKDVKLHVSQTKSIVFSVWKRTLDLVQLLFTAHGIQYCRVDGSVSTVKQRKEILETFQKRDEYRVLLMTLGTGAVGLNNLSVASRIYILEPQWNPSVERQAIGRVVRLGQEKEVKIVRFIMRTQYSIEETVEKCQEQKLYLASGGLNLAQTVKDSWAI